jgi:pyroglutamyl-peptidase
MNARGRGEKEMRTLLTAFGPFDIFSSNPSELLAKALSGEFGCRCTVLPVVFGKARNALISALEEERPDLVISFGLNGYISHIALERIALNIAYSEIPDNEGIVREASPIDPLGPLAFRSGLPLELILPRVRSAGIPCRYSFSAGTYICNEVFYTLMQYCEREGVRGGFIHIPMASHLISEVPRLQNSPHLSFEQILSAGRIALSECLR